MKVIVIEIVVLFDDKCLYFEGFLLMVFGCMLEGLIDEVVILNCVECLMVVGCDEVGLLDIIGYGDLVFMKYLIWVVCGVVGDDNLIGVYLYNMCGFGLVNVLVVFEEGIIMFDSLFGGFGGCLIVLGVSGNIVIEDLVFMFEFMGVKMGIDIDVLMVMCEMIGVVLFEEELYGFMLWVGLLFGYKF